MQLTAGAKVLFVGDSITDAGRSHPVGEAPGGLGNGYVSLIDAMLQVRHPELGLRVVNQGSSGHTIRDLADRWQRDVLDPQPEWVSLMIGVNDVWRQFDHPFRPELHVRRDEYTSTLNQLVKATLPHVKGLVLVTPFFMEPSRNDAMRLMVDSYGDIVREVAQARGAVLVDAQAAVDRLLTFRYSAYLGWDRVHPNHVGTFAVAEAWYQALNA